MNALGLETSRTQQKYFMEQIQIALSRPFLWERCRDLAKALQSPSSLSASSKELQTAFSLVCGDVFGYPAGGTGVGWDVGHMPLKGSSCSNRDFYAAFSFLNASGPMLELIDRLTCHLANASDTYQLYEFPVSQLPVSRQCVTSNVSRNVYLSPFEFYFYHFANCPIRRHQLTGQQQQQPGMASNVGDFLYPMLLEDYLNCFLPLDRSLQVKLFTQSRAHQMTPQVSSPTTMPSPVHDVESKGRTTLFRREFIAGDRRTEANHEAEAACRTVNRTSPLGRSSFVVTNEIWRSEIMVKVFALFWLESYAEGMNVPDPSSGDYLTVSLRNSASLPSSELLRLLRMFLKHSHYFSNACKSGGIFIPSNFKSDVFCGDQDSKRALFAFFVRTIDHWPLDASFRLVLETWLSYIQPWRYTKLNVTSGKNEDVSSPVDRAQWSGFVNDNYKFYTTLLAKILSRFFRVDLASSKSAYMLFRVAKVYSQENLLFIIQEASTLHGHSSAPSKSFVMSDDSKTGYGLLHFASSIMDDLPTNLFSKDFKDMMTKLLMACAEAKRAKLLECVAAENMSKAKAAKRKDSANHFVAMVLQLFRASNGSSATSDKAETEKALQHLDFVLETFGTLFELKGTVASESNRALQSRTGDRADGRWTSHDSYVGGEALTPSQRLDILYKIAKVESRYDGNPDAMPIRTDESAFLVRLSLLLSKRLNQRFREKIERWYYQDSGFLGHIFRQVCSPPCVYRRSDWDVMNHSGSCDGDNEVPDLSLCGSLRRQRYGKVHLPPRIVLRPLASYRALCYLAFYFFVSTFIFGKSFVGAFCYLMVFLTFVLPMKALVSPIGTNDDDMTEHATFLSYDAM